MISIGSRHELVQPPGTPKTVVIATNERDTAQRFADALSGGGHRTTLVNSAETLVHHINEAPASTDLLVIDLRLDTEGMPLIRALRAAAPGLRIVILSGSVQSAGDVRTLADLEIRSYVNEHGRSDHILSSLSPELFPDSFNRRTSMRVTLDIPVVYRYADTIATAPTLNLSKGGLGVRTLTPVDAGTKVRVTFRLPGSQEDLEATARVAWSDQKTGMGLQFEEMPTPDQSAVDEFIDRHVHGRKGKV